METKETALSLLEQNKEKLQLIARAFNPGMSQDDAILKVIREVTHVEQLMLVRPDLKGCTKESMFYAVQQCISDGLTLSPTSNLAQLVPGKIKTGQNGSQDIYEWLVTYKPTANGYISRARKVRRILDHKKPEITYNEAGQVETVTFLYLVPSPGKNRWESVVFGPTQFNRLRGYSHRKNSRGKQDANAETMNYANALYTSYKGGIDPEFAASKTIIHGLGKLGVNMDEIVTASNQNENIPIPKPDSVERNNGVIEPLKSESEYHEFEEIKAETSTNQSSDEIPDLI